MSSIIISGDTSGAITLSAPAVAGTQTATLPSATGTVMVSGNMPAFSAYQSSAQTISSATYTKIQFQTKEFDTANAFDATTNYRFQPTVAGYYQISAGVAIGSVATSIYCLIYKNGTAYKGNYLGVGGSVGANISGLVYCNGSTDYVEAYAYFGVGQAIATGTSFTYFQATMTRSA
jgi:hypothetical protein